MIRRNLLPGKDFRIDSIRCLEYYKGVKGDKNGEETSSSISTKIASITRDNKSIGQPYLSGVRGWQPDGCGLLSGYKVRNRDGNYSYSFKEVLLWRGTLAKNI